MTDFVAKEWHNDPDSGIEPTGTDTPIDAASLVDLEERLAAAVPRTLVLPFSQPGTLAVGTGAARLPLPVNLEVIGVTATVGTAPTGAAVIVDVMRNGASIFAPAGRPTIAVSTQTSLEATPISPGCNAGDLLSVDIDQIGSTVAGANLTVMVYAQEVATQAPEITKWASFTETFATFDTTDLWQVIAGSPAVLSGDLYLPTPGLSMVSSRFTKDLLQSSIVIDVLSTGGAYLEGDAELWLSSGALRIRMGVFDASPIRMFFDVKDSGGANHQLAAHPTWNMTTLRYWRIRESAGTIFWETSPDQSTWTERGTYLRADLGHADAVYQSVTLSLVSNAYGASPPALPDWIVGGINV